MSSASEEYIHQQESQTGSITAEPSLMTQPQYQYILDLLETSILSDFQKEQVIESLANHNMTMDGASWLIQDLLQQQKNPLDRVKDGELLLMSDLKTAIRKAVEDPNT